MKRGKLSGQKERMLGELEKSLGVVSEAARNAEISRTSHYNWLKADDEYKTAVEDLDNIVLDFAESELYKQIVKGNTSALIFLLKTKGKLRGYVEKTESENQNTNIIRIERTIVTRNLID